MRKIEGLEQYEQYRKVSNCTIKWDEDREAKATKLWKEGLSASQIARKLGGTTRNAVIGKIHRLGLAGRMTPTRRAYPDPAPKMRRRKQVVAKPPAAARKSQPLYDRRGQWSNRPPLHLLTAPQAVEPVAEVYIPPEQRKGVLDLGPNDCRWPIGDPRAKDFHFCGQRQAVGSYCEHHAQRAFESRPNLTWTDRVGVISTHGPDDLPATATKAA